jgi:hypothetical protein
MALNAITAFSSQQLLVTQAIYVRVLFVASGQVPMS